MPKFIDHERLAKMWVRGDRVDDICAAFGCCRNAVRYVVKLIGLPRRPRGWKPVGYSETLSRAKREFYRRFPKPKKPRL